MINWPLDRLQNRCTPPAGKDQFESARTCVWGQTARSVPSSKRQADHGGCEKICRYLPQGTARSGRRALSAPDRIHFRRVTIARIRSFTRHCGRTELARWERRGRAADRSCEWLKQLAMSNLAEAGQATPGVYLEDLGFDAQLAAEKGMAWAAALESMVCSTSARSPSA